MRNEEVKTESAERPTFISVTMTQDDAQALIRIRNYFGAYDKSQLEHLAFDVLDRIVKPIESPTKQK